MTDLIKSNSTAQAPLVGFYLICEAIEELEKRTHQTLTFKDFLRYAATSIIPLYLKFLECPSEIYILKSSTQAEPCFLDDRGPLLITDHDYFNNVIDALDNDEWNELLGNLPEVILDNQKLEYYLNFDFDIESSIHKMDEFEFMFRVRGEDLNNFISSFELDRPSTGPKNTNTSDPIKRLSTQGENSYKRSLRALAQALIGTLPDSPSKADINEISKILLDNGVEDPQTVKTWIKHLTNPD